MASMQAARSAARPILPLLHQRIAASTRPLASQSRYVRSAANSGQIQPRRGHERVMRRDPFRDPFDSMFDLVDGVFGGRATHPAYELSRQLRSIPIDVTETPEAYSVKADMPGVARDSIQLEVDGDTISLSVKQGTDDDATEETEDGHKVHRMERSSSFVKRTVRMPDAADMEKVKAGYKDGVLTLDVPKKEQAVARRRQIPVGDE